MKKIIIFAMLLFLWFSPGIAQHIKYITNYEYWFDTDYPAHTSVSLVVPVIELDIDAGFINTGSLSAGLHTFHIRFQDDSSNWSITQTQQFYNTPTTNSLMIAYEYWFDNDFANHSYHTVVNQMELDLTTFVDAVLLNNGLHVLHIRFLDAGGSWSIVQSQVFVKFGSNIVSNSVIGYRYYFNNNPNALISVTLPTPVNPLDLINQIDTRNYTVAGDNVLHIQFEDTPGAWSVMISETFHRDSIPVAAFGSNTPVCFNQATNFTNMTTEADTYLWDFGDGNTDTASSPTHNYILPGTYTVMLSTHSSVSGLDSSISHDVVVYPLPAPIISSTSGSALCDGNDVTLDAGVYSSYLWTNGATDETILISAGGDYVVTVSDGNGCTNTASITITGNSIPTPTILPSGSTIFCDGGSVTLQAGNYASYSWSNGATTSSIHVTVSGVYEVTVTDVTGCSATATQSVTVNPNPVLTISHNGPVDFCNGSSVTLDAGAHSSYHWSNGATTESILVTTTGNNSVTVTNSFGCIAIASQFVNSNGLPSPTITASGPTTFCDGGSVDLSVSAYAAYLWSTGATTSSITISTSGNL